MQISDVLKTPDAPDFSSEFFHILKTTDLSQVAVMTIKPGEDGGPAERHDADQIIYVLEGEAEVMVEDKRRKLHEGDCVVIEKGKLHHVKSVGKEDLFFLTVYSPPAYSPPRNNRTKRPKDIHGRLY